MLWVEYFFYTSIEEQESFFLYPSSTKKRSTALFKTINYSMWSFTFIAVDIQCFMEGIQLSLENFGF